MGTTSITSDEKSINISNNFNIASFNSTIGANSNVKIIPKKDIKVNSGIEEYDFSNYIDNETSIIAEKNIATDEEKTFGEMLKELLDTQKKLQEVVKGNAMGNYDILKNYPILQTIANDVLTPEQISKLKDQYKGYPAYDSINIEEYKKQYNSFFKEVNGIEYFEYNNKIKEINNQLLELQKEVDSGKYYNTTLATGAVVVEKVTAGLLDIVEWVDDGLAWAGGKITDATSFVDMKIVSLFSKEKAKQMQIERKEEQKIREEQIAFNRVDALEDLFYDTKFGQKIDKSSLLKHDSETAEKIEGISTKVGEFAAATAATIGTGGAAAPALIGFFEGAGKTAEKAYSDTSAVTAKDEWGIFFKGAGSAFTWMTAGKTGEAGVNLVNRFASGERLAQGQVTNFVQNNTSFREVIKNRREKLEDKVIDAIVDPKSFAKNSVKNIGKNASSIMGNFLTDDDQSFGGAVGSKLVANTESKVIDIALDMLDAPPGCECVDDLVRALWKDGGRVVAKKELIKVTNAAIDGIGTLIG